MAPAEGTAEAEGADGAGRFGHPGGRQCGAPRQLTIQAKKNVSRKRSIATGTPGLLPTPPPSGTAALARLVEFSRGPVAEACPVVGHEGDPLDPLFDAAPPRPAGRRPDAARTGGEVPAAAGTGTAWSAAGAADSAPPDSGAACGRCSDALRVVERHDGRGRRTAGRATRTNSGKALGGGARLRGAVSRPRAIPAAQRS
ncbi:hypothetical protein GCM10019016_102970 [Streptomyces prasinosporus]|uniref:Uncharacterized protein n=1 Tax=Streptomyces prasinosporus TaxID=68256 RepID=A0ABP6TXD1_9ACTN